MAPQAKREGDRPADILCLSHLRWDGVFQRPQQLLTRAARSRRVFYVEEPVATSERSSLDVRPADANIWVVTPRLTEGTPPEEGAGIQAHLLERLIDEVGLERYVLWFYTPQAVPLARELRPAATVYDCMDELSAFAGAPRTLRDREGELFDSADLVFTGGPSLYDAKRERHGNVHLFPSAVDLAHFARARDPRTAEPPDQAGIPGIRLGYFGVIDERIDLGLLEAVARAEPEWQIVMVGPVTKIDEASLPRAENIHYLGQRDYGELPAYVSGWAVALMPFALNDATRFISPTKTPEYLAAGVPVVSTPVQDVVRTWGEPGLVRVASDPASFTRAIRASIEEDFAPTLERADEVLAELSWDRTWERMDALIGRAARGSGPTPGSDSSGNGDGRTVRLGAETPPVPPPGPGFDYLVVGAGFAGAILAERLASQGGKRVLVVERRNHIGGNAYDTHDEAGIRIHRYGPHIFHTNARDVFEYLSAFTAWRPYEHRVLASVDGRLLPIPINLDTINELYGLQLDTFGVERFFESAAEPVPNVRTSEDVVVSKVGRDLYEKFFRNYTRKQWGLDPSELDATVTSRVPTRTNRDPRYFTDTYQVMPADGYARMFERILDHPNIKVLLNTDYREVIGLVPYGEVLFTGPIDEYFDHRLGRLPYRSLEFVFETHDREWFQAAPVVNYPNHQPYTRITEFKYLTGQVHPKTTVVYEYPRAEGDPYYPIPMPANAELYRRYKDMAEVTPGVHFAGRLGTYRYYNMDQVAAQALAVARRLLAPDGSRQEVPDAIVSSTRAVGRDRVHT